MLHARRRLASLLLLTTMMCPAAALAQDAGAAPPVQTPPTGDAAGDETAIEAPGTEAQTGVPHHRSRQQPGFHERAHMLKALGLAIMARKEELYELNYETGATRNDGWIDIEIGQACIFFLRLLVT